MSGRRRKLTGSSHKARLCNIPSHCRAAKRRSECIWKTSEESAISWQVGSVAVSLNADIQCGAKLVALDQESKHESLATNDLDARGADPAAASLLASSRRGGRSRSSHSASLAGYSGAQVFNSGEEQFE